MDYLGWTATAIFVGSYFCGRAEVLRGVQIVGASLWVIYGILMPAPPVIVANVLVILAATWTAARSSAVRRMHAGDEPS